MSHVAQQVVQSLLTYPPVSLLPRELPGVQVGAGQEGVVVEHLLEVGHQPFVVGGIAVETSSQVVEDAPCGHGVQGLLDLRPYRRVGLQRLAGEKIIDEYRLRELGSTSPAAVDGVERGAESLQGAAVQDRRLRGVVRPARGSPARVAHALDESSGCPFEFFPPPGPCLGEGLQHLLEGGHAVAGAIGKVGSSVERSSLRREPDAERPSTSAGQGGDGVHVDGVQIGTLLPVHLDADEVAVEQFRGGRIRERLPLHHVAPVAGGVADAQEDGLVLPRGPPEGLLSPGVPVDRVVDVLEKVGTALTSEMVGHAASLCRSPAGRDTRRSGFFPAGRVCIQWEQGKQPGSAVSVAHGSLGCPGMSERSRGACGGTSPP